MDEKLRRLLELCMEILDDEEVKDRRWYPELTDILAEYGEELTDVPQDIDNDVA